MKKAVTLLIAFGVVVSLSEASFATVIHVPADQPTIQAGIDAAIPGDTVFVADGTYTGNGNRDIDFGGKGIVLKSENGPDFTIIDCQGDSLDPHRGFYFHSGEDSTAVVDGFTIRNGNAVNGGGISCNFNSSPTISDNTISGNSANNGGGIHCRYSSPTISNNTISGNSASYYGGGIYCRNSNPTISDNTFSGNSAYNGGGISCRIGSNSSIIDNTFSGNSAVHDGGGIHCDENSNAFISNNHINNNSANSGGGILTYNANPTIGYNIIDGNLANAGGGIFCAYSTNPVIINNTISGNSADGDGAISCFDSNPTVENCIIAFSKSGRSVFCNPSSNATLTCCDVYGNEGGDWVGCIAGQADTNGNFSADPLFCDTAAVDFSLSKFSPCLPQYNSCGVLIGSLDLGCTGPYICGDANGDSLVNQDDVAFLQAFYFDCSSCPDPLVVADVNCDGSVDIADIVYLAQFLNGTGPEPCCW